MPARRTNDWDRRSRAAPALVTLSLNAAAGVIGMTSAPRAGRRKPAAAATLPAMNTYAVAGCCSATLPTMQDLAAPSMLRPQHAAGVAP